MKMWTPSELEEGLLDYLYDELEPDERRSFEQALAARPDLAAELERHRLVRGAAAGLAPIPMPTAALQSVLAAADAEAERRRHAGAAVGAGGAGFWTRLRGWLMHPAFATASVALIVAGVGLTMSQRGATTSDARDDQSLPAKVREPVAVPGGSAVATPVATEAAPKAEEKAVAADKAPAQPAQPERAETREAATKLAAGLAKDEPFGAARVDEPTPSPQAPEPRKLADRGAAGGDNAGAAGERAKQVVHAAPDDVAEHAVTNGLMANGPGNAPKPEAAGFAANSDLTTTKDGVVAGDVKSKTDASERPKTADAAPMLDAFAKENELARARRPENAPPQTDDNDKAPSPPPAEPAASNKKILEEAARDQGRNVLPPAPNANQGRSPQTGSKPADSGSNDVQLRSPAKLWTTYGQQMAAGAWTDAAKTLAEIDKLGTDGQRVQQARAELKKRAQAAAEAQKESPSKLPDPGLKPTTDTKPNTQP